MCKVILDEDYIKTEFEFYELEAACEFAKMLKNTLIRKDRIERRTIIIEVAREEREGI